MSGSAPWQALALRRDIQTLQSSAPPHGLSSLSQSRASYKQFDRDILHALNTLNRRAGVAAQNLAGHALFGPWGVGLSLSSPDEQFPPLTSVSNLSILCWNIRGALSVASKQEGHSGRILQLITALHSSQASIAILSDPCFGPGMQWPQWSGYFGTPSTQSNTVAALISAEVTDKVVLLESFGDARNLWFHIQVPVNASSFLLLAIYAPPPNYVPKERLEFFEARLDECRKLRGDPLFSSLPMLLAGDVNLHAAELCEKNRSLERPVDRDIASVITGPLGLNLALRNPLQTATRDSGSALDLIYSSHNFNPVIQVLAKEKFPLSSDHRPILITQLGSVPQAARPNLGKTKWKPFSDAWNDALLNIP